jgi:glyoxylase-like metal-dependent hydrolase (beta-lactamase superfamily II)
MTEVHSINAGFFRIDGGAMFGVVPRVLWQDKCIPDEKNRILQATRVLLIIDGPRKILIDTGMGNWHDRKFIDRFCLEKPDFDFNDALAAHKISTDDITDVIITHLHFDHAGGLVSKKGEGIELTFPNASIWLQQQQWQWAQNPSSKDRSSFIQTYIDIIRDHPKLKLLEGTAEITTNVSVLPFHGHSPAMQTVIVKSDSGTCWFPSDLIPMAWHLRIPYGMAYDNNSVLSAEEKEKMLSKVRLEKWLIFFYHDPIYEKTSEELIAEFTKK